MLQTFNLEHFFKSFNEILIKFFSQNVSDDFLQLVELHGRLHRGPNNGFDRHPSRHRLRSAGRAAAPGEAMRASVLVAFGFYVLQGSVIPFTVSWLQDVCSTTNTWKLCYQFPTLYLSYGLALSSSGGRQ
jgi:hypothetical protein